MYLVLFFFCKCGGGGIYGCWLMHQIPPLQYIISQEWRNSVYIKSKSQWKNQSAIDQVPRQAPSLGDHGEKGCIR